MIYKASAITSTSLIYLIDIIISCESVDAVFIMYNPGWVDSMVVEDVGDGFSSRKIVVSHLSDWGSYPASFPLLLLLLSPYRESATGDGDPCYSMLTIDQEMSNNVNYNCNKYIFLLIPAIAC